MKVLDGVDLVQVDAGEQRQRQAVPVEPHVKGREQLIEQVYQFDGGELARFQEILADQFLQRQDAVALRLLLKVVLDRHAAVHLRVHQFECGHRFEQGEVVIADEIADGQPMAEIGESTGDIGPSVARISYCFLHLAPAPK